MEGCERSLVPRWGLHASTCRLHWLLSPSLWLQPDMLLRTAYSGIFVASILRLAALKEPESRKPFRLGCPGHRRQEVQAGPSQYSLAATAEAAATALRRDSGRGSAGSPVFAGLALALPRPAAFRFSCCAAGTRILPEVPAMATCDTCPPFPSVCRQHQLRCRPQCLCQMQQMGCCVGPGFELEAAGTGSECDPGEHADRQLCTTLFLGEAARETHGDAAARNSLQSCKLWVCICRLLLAAGDGDAETRDRTRPAARCDHFGFSFELAFRELDNVPTLPPAHEKFRLPTQQCMPHICDGLL